MSSPKFLPPSVRSRAAADPIPQPVETPLEATPAADQRIHSIAVGRGTRGIDTDGVPGDDGVLVVLEARNNRGEAVVPAAEVTVVVIDPAIEGEGGRYARWDFEPDGTAALYRPADARESGGAYFDLAWPDAPPAHDRLKLFIRLTTADGRRLEASRDLVVDLKGDNAVTRRAQSFRSPPSVVPAAARQGTAERLNWGRTPTVEAIGAPATLPAPLEHEAAPIPLEISPVDPGPLLIPAVPSPR
jgi:hypothetical protein